MPNVVTPVFRVSYPAVFKPKLNKLSQKQEFSVQALFPAGEKLEGLKKAAQAAVIEKWGQDKNKWPKNLRLPFKTQDEKTDSETGKSFLPPGYTKGAYMLDLKAAQKPGLVDANVQPILDESEFYPGCYAKASVSVFAYDKAGNRGVSFGLVNIQKVKDGDPLGGRTRAEDDFAPVEGFNDETSEGSSTDGLFG